MLNVQNQCVLSVYNLPCTDESLEQPQCNTMCTNKLSLKMLKCNNVMW